MLRTLKKLNFLSHKINYKKSKSFPHLEIKIISFVYFAIRNLISQLPARPSTHSPINNKLYFIEHNNFQHKSRTFLSPIDSRALGALILFTLILNKLMAAPSVWLFWIFCDSFMSDLIFINVT
jgi:hypothetical protein